MLKKFDAYRSKASASWTPVRDEFADEAVVGVKRPSPETERDPDPGAQPAKRHKAGEPQPESASSSAEVVAIAAA